MPDEKPLSDLKLEALLLLCEVTSVGPLTGVEAELAKVVPRLVAELRRAGRLLPSLVETLHKNRRPYGSSFMCVYCEAGAEDWDSVRHYAHCPLGAVRALLPEEVPDG